MTIPGHLGDTESLRDRLRSWSSRRLPAARDIEISTLDVPAAGYSGGTALLELSYRQDGIAHRRALALRRQAGDPLFLDEDLRLQWRMMQAANAAGIPAPRLAWFEEDTSVIGEPFYLMDRVAGRIPLDRPSFHAEGWIAELPIDARRALTNNALATLARLHRLPWREGFEFLAKAHGPGEVGLDRYLGWIERWYAWVAREWLAKGYAFPVLEAGLRYARTHQPENPPVAVLWGDCRLGNIFFASNNLSIAALLDWEMAALGPPELDLAWWLMMERFWSEGVGVKPLAGFPDAAESRALFETHLGRRAENLAYYDILAWLRFSIISLRQVARRIAVGVLPPGADPTAENAINRSLREALERAGA